MAVTKAVSLKAGIGQAHKNAVELAKNTEVMQITIIPDIFLFPFISISICIYFGIFMLLIVFFYVLIYFPIILFIFFFCNHIFNFLH